LERPGDGDDDGGELAAPVARVGRRRSGPRAGADRAEGFHAIALATKAWHPRRIAAKAAHNLHVPLSGPVHDRLRAEAVRSGRPATTLAREAIEAWIAERERRAVHQAIVDYASEMAGSPADLDDDLEKAAVEQLVRRRQKR